MILHLTNTFVLLGCLSLTAAWAAGLPAPRKEFAQKGSLLLFTSGALLVLVVGITGAIAALGDTLFPATTFLQGFRQDFAQTSHLLLKLRVLHPAFALATGGYLILSARALQAKGAKGHALKASQGVIGLVLTQLSLGFVNLALLAPVPLQLVHLLLAELVWIAWLILGAATFSQAPTGFTFRAARNVKATPA